MPRPQQPIAPARRVAHDVLVRVARDKAYADRALDAVLTRAPLEPRDRALATELVYGTLRQMQRLDFYLSRFAQKPLRKLPLPALVAMRMAAYQILDLRTPAHAAINDAVSLVRLRAPHVAGVANAVLRKIATHQEQGTLPSPSAELPDPIEALAIEGAHPTWLVRRIVAERGEAAARAWIAANNEPPPLALRVSRRHPDREALAAKLRDMGAEVELPELVPGALLVRGGGRVPDLPGFREGEFVVQDLGAQLVGRLLTPAPRALVLDACAAPGGKSVQLAEMLPEGKVLACDIHRAKLRLVADSALRLGLANVVTAAVDSGDPAALAELLAQHGAHEVDAALVDAPCSGLGTLRRNPELRERSEADLAMLCATQDRILEAVADVVRPGGLLVYAVCTVTHEEGPDRVKAFLARHGDFRLGWPDDPVLAAVSQPFEGGRVLRTWSDRHGCDGFFAARLERRSRA